MFVQSRKAVVAFALLAVAFMLSLPIDAQAHGISEVDRQRMLTGGHLQYVRLGATPVGARAEDLLLHLASHGAIQSRRSPC